MGHFQILFGYVPVRCRPPFPFIAQIRFLFCLTVHVACLKVACLQTDVISSRSWSDHAELNINDAKQRTLTKANMAAAIQASLVLISVATADKFVKGYC